MLDSGHIKLGPSRFAKGCMWDMKEREKSRMILRIFA
jgi:hypothetical protein